jgi:pimeloyl-ACP methyl ester carboxylesterase
MVTAINPPLSMRRIVREVHVVRTPDGVPLRLTHLRGGHKGPVLVAHGVGVWSGMFSLPTIPENFTQYLVRHGYDVWLLDWRGSIQLPLRQFTFDEAAEHDFPTAVRHILDATGADSVQAVVHCAGSATFFAALASGLLPEVRCVAASQVAMHFVTPWATRLKAHLRIAEGLSRVGVDSLTPAADPARPWFQKVLGAAVDLVHRECKSTVCHRLTFLYGHLYEHAQLNQETHARLTEQFGACNITTFVHLAQLARQINAQGFDHGRAENRRRYGTPWPKSYRDPRHLRLPITFVSGERNRTFLPRSTELTFEWLCAENGPAHYRRHVVPGYGHLDSFMGDQASRDVYPLFLEQLEACPA